MVDSSVVDLVGVAAVLIQGDCSVLLDKMAKVQVVESCVLVLVGVAEVFIKEESQL